MRHLGVDALFITASDLSLAKVIAMHCALQQDCWLLQEYGFPS